MLSADLDDGYGARDYLGGGYFEQFIVWWWVPAFTSILAIGLLPHVPYANRVGSQKGASSLIRKVEIPICRESSELLCNVLPILAAALM